MAKIGFVGLGDMGGPIAGHLVADGHDVTAYDLRAAAIEDAVAAGARPADGPAEVADGAGWVFLSLPTPEAVSAVVDDLAGALDAGAVLVDLTTSTPATTSAVADRLADRGVDVLGAPVSGGKAGARAGDLSAMVGGDPAVYEAARPLLSAFAAETFHVGEGPGDGHAVKLLNNYVSVAGLLAASEAVALGRRAGLDRETVVDALDASTGRNSATEVKLPEHVLTGEYDTGFPLELVEKDARLFAAFAEDADAPVLLGSVVRQLIGHARSELGPDADMTRLYDFVASKVDRDES